MIKANNRNIGQGRLRPSLSPNFLGWLVSAILALLILYPLAAVMIQVVFPGVFFGDWNPGNLSLLLDVFSRPLWRQSMLNSLLLAGGTTVFATLLGGGLAMLRSSWSFPTARWLDLSVWVLLITPSFILAQGWVLFASSNGFAHKIFGWDWVTSLVFQPAGLVAIMVLSKFPFAYLSVYTAMEWKVDQLGGAAKLCGASPFTVWRTIWVPLLLPAFLAGAALVFMDTIGDFGLPSALAAVYRFPTLPYSIYSAIYTSPIRFDMAGVLSFYLVLFIAIAMFVQFYALRKARFDFLSSRATAAVPKKMGRKGLLLTAGNVLFLILVIGIPMGTNVAVSFMNNISRGFVWSNWTLHYYRELFVNKQALFQGLYHSLMIAGSTAVISLIIGFLVAYVLIYSRFRWKRLIDIFSLVTLAVPGVVLGIGYIFVWNQAWLENIGLLLYGTPWILVLASVAGAIPIITRIIIGSLTKIPIQLIHAAELQGVGFIRRSHEILLPLIRGALLSAGLAAFGSSVFDLAVSTILYPPNFMTLPVAINKGFEDLKFGYATAATMLGGGFVILIILLLELAFRRKERQLHD